LEGVRIKSAFLLLLAAAGGCCSAVKLVLPLLYFFLGQPLGFVEHVIAEATHSSAGQRKGQKKGCMPLLLIRLPHQAGG
jgi:hypothetical protein